ncbi:MAG: hypothetical protein Q9166_006104 [cf. Caloplaca sp. 2 TL-2023]
MVSYLLIVFLILSNLDGFHVAAHLNQVTKPSKYCTIVKHPEVSDLAGTTYINHVRTASLPSFSDRIYRYVHYPPNPKSNKPTILFLHGFPSTSFDWRRQFKYFASRGYGVVAPDLLGFGGTDKPSDPTAYTLKKQAAEVVGLLDCVTGDKEMAVVVGHDLLSNIPSPLILRLIDTFFLDTVQQDSVWSISYTSDEPKYWPTKLCPAGALEAFLRADGRVPIAAWVSSHDETIHNSIFAPKRGGYNPSLNHYRANYRNLSLADENAIPPSAANLTKPTLLLTARNDPVGTPTRAEGSTRPFAPDLRVKEIVAGHFLMLEKAGDVNEAMRTFFEE